MVEVFRSSYVAEAEKDKRVELFTRLNDLEVEKDERITMFVIKSGTRDRLEVFVRHTVGRSGESLDIFISPV